MGSLEPGAETVKSAGWHNRGQGHSDIVPRIVLDNVMIVFCSESIMMLYAHGLQHDINFRHVTLNPTNTASEHLQILLCSASDDTL